MSSLQEQPSSGLHGNIVDYLLERSMALEGGHRPYLRTPTGDWTFAMLSERVDRIGNALKELGLAPGQRVLFSVVDGIDFPALFLGIMKIGGVALPINTYLKPADYQYYINDSGAEVVIVDHLLAPLIMTLRPGLETVRHVVTTRQSVIGLPYLDDLIRKSAPSLRSHPVGPDEMAFWLYSSGSTGAPKGVVHTGNHIYWATELFGLGTQGICEHDVILCPPKMFFAFGLGNQVYFPLRAGAQNIVNPDAITPAAVWKQWLEYQPTIVVGVPTLFTGMLRLAEKSIDSERIRRASERLRFCVSGGEILPTSLMRRWRDVVGVDILDGVGTTEMTHMFMLNERASPVPGSCGRVVRGFRAEVVDDQGKLAPRGEVGNLRMFGPTAATQYWNKPEQTARVMAGGGVLTGDKVYEDDAGNFFMVGRSDDMLRVGGIWVSPAEVEGAISEHDAVLECAVVGHPDEDGLIKPKAFVVLREPASSGREDIVEALRTHVRGKLAHVKCPRWFELVDELPKTSTGKIQRFRLRGDGGKRLPDLEASPRPATSATVPARDDPRGVRGLLARLFRSSGP